jgi:hypothetical protein
MAYEQRTNYPQQQSQPYYNQGSPRPQQGQHPANYDNYQYNEQYDDYGYGQGQYDQWGNGYQDQPMQNGWGDGNMNGQRPPQQRYQGENVDYNRPMQNAPQGRPPPRDQYGQAPIQQDNGMQRGDSRGRGTGRPPNIQQGQPGLRAPGMGTNTDSRGS